MGVLGFLTWFPLEAFARESKPKPVKTLKRQNYITPVSRRRKMTDAAGAGADSGLSAAEHEIAMILKRRTTLEPGGGLTELDERAARARRLHERAAARAAAGATRPKKDVPTALRFVFGTASAITATFFTHPIDVVKYRMQLASAGAPQSTVGAARALVASDGVGGLYKGLTASMMRQASYGTTRLGLYTSLLERFTLEDGTPPPLLQKLGISMTAGAVGAVVGNPFDLALVRMAADSSLPEAARRNYSNVFDAVGRIVRTEGVPALWIGCGPTVSRCVILNMAQLTTYSQAKEELLKTSMFQDNIWCHLVSSMISGFVATAASTPFDVAKTRVQNQVTQEYSGMLDCLSKTAKNEGVLSLWKGFTPAYLRLAPQTVLIFVFLEQFNKIYQRL